MLLPNPGRSWRHFDVWLMLGVIGVVSFGLVAIYSANPRAAFQQLAVNLPMALIPFGFFVLWGYNWLEGRAAWIIYGIMVALLIAVDITGHSALGAQRWLSIGPVKIQPSEYAKLGLIVILARVLSQRSVHSPEGFMIPMITVGVPFLLIFAQPDLGTSLVFVAITLGMLFWAGLPIPTLFKMVSPVVALILCMPQVLFDDPAVHRASMILWGVYLLGLGTWLWKTRKQHWLVPGGVWLANLGAGLAVPIAWGILKEYQKNRIRTFVSPEADPLGTGYHVIQSKIAIGSGGLLGKGLLEGTQTQLHFIPEQHTDFVFSVVGEELGLIGGLLMLALYLTVIIRAILIANNAKDRFGSLLASGVASMLLFHMFVNLCMAMGLMPVVGIPLPMMSYGGSALMTNLAAIGLLQAISMRRKKLLF
mgnify:CR=1 FL=1